MGVSDISTIAFLRPEFAPIDARTSALEEALRAEVLLRDIRIAALEEALRAEVSSRDARIIALEQKMITLEWGTRDKPMSSFEITHTQCSHHHEKENKHTIAISKYISDCYLIRRKNFLR